MMAKVFASRVAPHMLRSNLRAVRLFAADMVRPPVTHNPRAVH